MAGPLSPFLNSNLPNEIKRLGASCHGLRAAGPKLGAELREIAAASGPILSEAGQGCRGQSEGAGFSKDSAWGLGTRGGPLNPTYPKQVKLWSVMQHFIGDKSVSARFLREAVRGGHERRSGLLKWVRFFVSSMLGPAWRHRAPVRFAKSDEDFGTDSDPSSQVVSESH